MPHLFISYAKKDTRELALSLADKLNEIEGVTAWVDRSLRAGQKWELEIQREIARCDTMIVLYSPDINRHLEGKEESYVLTEIHYAKRIVNKPIIPIMAQETTPPMALMMEQYIDFTLDGLMINNLVKMICDELDISIERSELDISKELIESANSIINVIGEPFEWCEVPTGEFIYSKGNNQQTLSLPKFYIAKYPITYSQFQAFIDAKNGFYNSRWWEGLATVQSNKPGDQMWQVNNHPRERVSFNDAMAFCRWLSWKLGGEYHIDNIAEWAVRLPTEFEWEKAARGTDGRIYPWGNNFDKHNANTKDTGLKKTTPVTLYPQGASPYGVLDMSGNVWEWCLINRDNSTKNPFDIGENLQHALRGGSWDLRYDRSMTSFRFESETSKRKNDFGFRIMRPS